MCGDIEDDLSHEDELKHRLDAMLRRLEGDSADVTTASDRPAYMAGLFRSLLQKCASDVDRAPDGHAGDIVASQAVVLARLAGVLASHLPPQNDLLSDTLDALLDGYRAPPQGPAHHHHHQYGGAMPSRPKRARLGAQREEGK